MTLRVLIATPERTFSSLKKELKAVNVIAENRLADLPSTLLVFVN